MINFIPAGEYVADTVAIVIYLEKRKLGAKAIFEAAENSITIIHIPTFVFAEILYLSEKRKITANLQDIDLLLQTLSNFREYPLTKNIIDTATQITDIPELHDRLISATARYLNLELITTDEKIQNSKFLKTIW